MILTLIAVVIGWFFIGWIINYIFYSELPQELHGTSQGAKFAHILLNIITVIIIILIG